MDTRGPMPRAPRRFVRDIDRHGHHRDCDCSLEAMDRDEHHTCTCGYLDQEDYESACEAKLDATRSGEYQRRNNDE